MNHKPFHVVLPTLNFETFYNKFFKGVAVFAPLKDFFSFGICFQNYTLEQIDIIKQEFEKYDLDLRYLHKHYNFDNNKVKMFNILNDCAQLNPNCLYYLSLDDDLWFDVSNECTLEILQSLVFLLENKKCAVLALEKAPKIQLSDFRIKLEIYNIETSHGLFLKNVNKNGQIIQEEYLNLVGGYSDRMLACTRLFTREYCAFIHNFHYGHHVEAKSKSEICFNKYGWNNLLLDKDSNATALKQIIKKYGYVSSVHNYHFDIQKQYIVEGTQEELINKLHILLQKEVK